MDPAACAVFRSPMARRRTGWPGGRGAVRELSPSVQARALDTIPGFGALRTLDTLHLASCAYLAEHGLEVALASYDRRMNAVARAKDIPLFDQETSPIA